MRTPRRCRPWRLLVSGSRQSPVEWACRCAPRRRSRLCWSPCLSLQPPQPCRPSRAPRSAAWNYACSSPCRQQLSRVCGMLRSAKVRARDNTLNHYLLVPGMGNTATFLLWANSSICRSVMAPITAGRLGCPVTNSRIDARSTARLISLASMVLETSMA